MTEQTETTITKATANDAGCWIDGHWGQYANARLVNIATENGWDGGAWGDEAEDIANRHLDAMGPSAAEDITSDEFEALSEIADDAESWLNDNVAPEGYSFGWFDGEFFLSRNESIGDGTSWEEVDDLA